MLHKLNYITYPLTKKPYFLSPFIIGKKIPVS